MLPEPFLSGTIACRSVVIPISFGSRAQHFYSLRISLSAPLLSSLCPILRSFLFHLLFLHQYSFFFVFSSLIFFYCAVRAFHCPCHLVDLHLFVVICLVASIVAAVLNLISMFHLILIFTSSFAFNVGLDRPVHVDHFRRLSLYINPPVIDHMVPKCIHCCVSCLVIVVIRLVSSFSLSPVTFRFVFISLPS